MRPPSAAVQSRSMASNAMAPRSSSSASTTDIVNSTSAQSAPPEAAASVGCTQGKRGREVDPTGGMGPAPSTSEPRNGKLMRGVGAPPEESNPPHAPARHPIASPPPSRAASKPCCALAGGELPTGSKAALCAAAQVVVLAGDAAAFTEEINTMRLGPITYELLVFSHAAIMSVVNARPPGLPGGRQPIPKALAWLVAVAV